MTGEIPTKETAIQKLRDTVSGTDGFISKAKRYTDITELTPELLRLFIQKIVVHEKSVKYSKHSEQTVEIHYTDIGYIGGEIQQDKESPQQEIILFLERKSITKNFSAFVKVFWPKDFRSVTEVRF